MGGVGRDFTRLVGKEEGGDRGQAKDRHIKNGDKGKRKANSRYNIKNGTRIYNQNIFPVLRKLSLRLQSFQKIYRRK